jgi:phytoene dehydrogenase-like protein
MVAAAPLGGVPWTHEPSRRAGTVHVGGTLAEIAAKENMVHAGRMPDEPFVLVCQRYLADPSRSNTGVHPLYAYAHVPAGWTGDATDAIEAQIVPSRPGSGSGSLRATAARRQTSRRTTPTTSAATSSPAATIRSS